MDYFYPITTLLYLYQKPIVARFFSTEHEPSFGNIHNTHSPSLFMLSRCRIEDTFHGWGAHMIRYQASPGWWLGCVWIIGLGWWMGSHITSTWSTCDCWVNSIGRRPIVYFYRFWSCLYNLVWCISLIFFCKIYVVLKLTLMALYHTKNIWSYTYNHTMQDTYTQWLPQNIVNGVVITGWHVV